MTVQNTKIANVYNQLFVTNTLSIVNTAFYKKNCSNWRR